MYMIEIAKMAKHAKIFKLETCWFMCKSVLVWFFSNREVFEIPGSDHFGESKYSIPDFKVIYIEGMV